MRKVYEYIRPHLAHMSLQMTIKFVATIIELLLPWMLAKILDEIAPARNVGQVYAWGGLMILCAAIALAGNIIANQMATLSSRDIIEQMRHDLFARIASLSSSQTDRFTIPSLISRLTSDTYNVYQMLDRMQRLGVRAPILMLGGIAVSIALEPVMTLPLLGIMPLLGLIIWYVSRSGIPLYDETQSALDRMVRKVQETMSGVRVIKALSKSEYEQQRFDEANQDVQQHEQRARTVMGLTSPAMNLLLNLGLTLVIIVGAYRVQAGVTQPGMIIAFLSYFTIILNALIMVSRLFNLYSKGAASADRIAEVLGASEDMTVSGSEPAAAIALGPLLEITPELSNKPDIASAALAAPADASPADVSPAGSGSPHVEFRHVSFSYNKVQNDLADISFRLKRGETLGIIGPTGSGKSTILSLMLRFYDPDAGDIRINGRPLSELQPEWLHSRFGVVFQNDFLLADSIRDNIDFGRNLAEDQIRNAARDAQADFISRREHDFASQLSVKGSNLSGGQKQRLLIARALAVRPDILLLDDCSSALDYRTDAALRHTLARQYGDTTKIIVAQRVSSIMNAEQILVLEDGRIIGSGTHAELMAGCDSYREIYSVQMGEMAG